MRRHVATIIALFAFFALYSSAHSASASAENIASTKRVQAAALDTKSITPQRGTLYRATYHGHTCYLFGTVHVGKTVFYPLEPQVTKALNQADKLIIEVDIRNAAAFQQAIIQYGLYPQGESIAQHISADTLTKLKQALQRDGISFEQISRMKPWMVANLLIVQEMARNGFPTEQGIELHFLSVAQQQQKTVGQLETAADQLSIFDKLTTAQQENYLRENMKDLESGLAMKQGLALINAWQHADTTRMEKLMHEMNSEQSSVSALMQRLLIDQRNPRMAEKIEALLKNDKASFVAIGTLHLIGDNSVPKLLRQRGYQVQKLY